MNQSRGLGRVLPLVRARLGVGVGALLLAEGGDDVDEAPVVLDTTLGAARPLLLLLLFVHLQTDRSGVS